jgi:hypothetical protein
MSWVRIDDKAWSHPKLAGLSGNAVRLWLFALCWCNQQESDGHVPATMLRVLGASPKVAAELVAAGLWEVVEDGWQFHDYLNYQPSREQLASQRNATKERVTKYRERSRNGVTPTIGNAPVTPPPPQPNPTQPDHPSGDGREPGKPAPRPRAARWRRVPASWEPNESHAAIAAELRVDLASELRKFRDHEFRDPKSDADATFRTWLRRAGEYSPPRQVSGGGGGSTVPMLMARVQRLEAEGEGS